MTKFLKIRLEFCFINKKQKYRFCKKLENIEREKTEIYQLGQRPPPRSVELLDQLAGLAVEAHHHQRRLQLFELRHVQMAVEAAVDVVHVAEKEGRRLDVFPRVRLLVELF